jgi:hypothetical protein
MCPSDVFEISMLRNPAFGPEFEVFNSADYNPCSIVLRGVEDDVKVRIQVRTERSEWKDYEQGDLIVGKSVKCRLAAVEGDFPEQVKVEVFHT